MGFEEYISAINGVRDVRATSDFGDTEDKFFVDFFIFANDKRSVSAYQLCAHMKKMGRPIAYKNVNKKVHRLHDLGLIEKQEENFKHGAIYYNVSISGWLHFYAVLAEKPFITSTYWNFISKYYNHHIFFKTLISPYFEFETIKRIEEPFGNRWLHLIHDYLTKCAFTTLRLSNSMQWRTDIVTYFNNFLEWQLRHSARNLLFDIIGLLTSSPIEIEEKKEVKAIFTNDRKFMAAIKEFDQDFRQTYSKFMETSAK